MNFIELGLNQRLVDGLAKGGITQPTPVQEGGIPLLLAGKDGILQSQTGSGKTLAYLLPIYARQPETVERGNQVIVLVPTKELAIQIHQEVQNLSANSGIPLRSAVLFGNANIQNQIDHLKEKPQIIIGTSDRVLALIQKKKIAAHLVKTLIVDEADKLLDKQNLKNVLAVRKCLMKFTQCVFVSATFDPEPLGAVKAIAPEAELVMATEQEAIPSSIKHQYLICEERDKLEKMRKLIFAMQPEKSIIFINDLEQIRLATLKLQYHQLNCGCIHSETTKQDRAKQMTDFKTGKITHLVATDLAARGLHVESVPCVFSIDIAQNPTDYLHRAGRCGRQGAEGTSICLITPSEWQFLRKYKSRYNIELEEITMSYGKVIPVKK